MDELQLKESIKNRLINIYNDFPWSEEQTEKLLGEIRDIKESVKYEAQKWDQENIILITYGDSIKKDGESPLKTLHVFLNENLKDSISHVHILPFFPFSSDDGFSVIDYCMVNPELGEWDHVKDIGKNYSLMFDLVINHVSQQSKWFQNYFKGMDPGKGYFIEVDPDTDLSAVVRPRSLPLLSVFDTAYGSRHVWTTFSSDQIDLNFANPEVLLEMLKVFLFYLEKGARIIRLDAIAFLWKEIGTSCLHLPQTHETVKLLHDIAAYISPSIIIITETNVPNKENLNYFGNGDEADMVYQFSLPPLLLHALYTGNSEYLTKWVGSLPDIPKGCTYFNFTASHDGIGIRPLEGLLPQQDILDLTQAMKNQGGHISTKRNADGTESPYEMNITYLDALSSTQLGEDNFQVDRFLCSQTLMMSFKGIPAFYIHSLLGTHNDHEGVKRTGMFRSINRHKWNADLLLDHLKKNTEHAFILGELSQRIAIRKKEVAFHPDSPQKVISSEPYLFIMLRGWLDELLVIANLSYETKSFDLKSLPFLVKEASDLLDNNRNVSEKLSLKPYQVCWIKKADT